MLWWPLLRYLSMQVTIAQWNMSKPGQSQFARCSGAAATWLSQIQRSTCAFDWSQHWRFARATVCPSTSRKSAVFTMAVGVHPALDWQAYYYVHLPCHNPILLKWLTTYFAIRISTPPRFWWKSWSKIWITLFHFLFQRVSVPQEANSAADDLWQQMTSLSTQRTAGMASLVKGRRSPVVMSGASLFHYFHPSM